MALSVRIDGTWLYNVRHHGEIDLVFYEYLGKDGTSGNDLNLVTSEVAISRLFLIEMKQVTHKLKKDDSIPHNSICKEHLIAY